MIDYISRLITSSKYILFLISSQKTHNLKCMCCPWTQFILTSTISVCVFFRSSKLINSKLGFHVGNKNRKYFNLFQTPVFYQDTKKMAAIALYCQRKIKGRCQHSLVNFFLIKKKGTWIQLVSRSRIITIQFWFGFICKCINITSTLIWHRRECWS